MLEQLAPLVPFIPTIINILFIGGGTLIGYGYWKRKEENQNDSIDNLKSQINNKEGRPLLMSISDCNNLRFSCKNSFDTEIKEYKRAICAKIDEVKLLVKEADDKREVTRKETSEKLEVTRKETSEKLEEIARFMGRVEQYMEDRNVRS